MRYKKNTRLEPQKTALPIEDKDFIDAYIYAWSWDPNPTFYGTTNDLSFLRLFLEYLHIDEGKLDKTLKNRFNNRAIKLKQEIEDALQKHILGE